MPQRPNVIQITTHDSGRHFGCYGHPTLHTPAVDALAADGVRLTNYFSTVPICCASRASQMTGQYPQTHGLMDLCFPPFNWRLNDAAQHLSHRFRAGGYRTLLFGIQHEVAGQEIDRLAFGDIRGQRRPSGGRATADVIANEAAQFLRDEAKSGQPFFAQVGFFETHTPFISGDVEPDTSKGLEIPPYLADTDASRQAMAGYQGAVRHADAAVGTILEALRQSGLEDNTLIVFTTDHGIEVPRAKWHVYDPGIAIALVLRYPAGGLTGGQTCDLLLSNVDYLPTVLDIAGLDAAEAAQGQSFAAALTQESLDPVREAVYGLYQKSQSRFVRTNGYKLIRHFDAAVRHNRLPATYEHLLQKGGGDPIELYDLTADPNEFSNVAGKPEHAAAQGQLDNLHWRWLEDVGDPLLDGPVRTPSYESARRDYQDWRGAVSAGDR